ncbi:MAG: hypothetical protein ED557_00960 [Balneola sp.]|nr:MAG: hypothetical protein ED557_00960 [Balneola sp.]
MRKPGFMRLLCALFAAVFISCAGSNQTIESPQQMPIDAVGVAGNQPVSYDELVQNYRSGNINGEFTLEELQEFLPIYLDYKAKILSAQDAGYFENEGILSEYEVYAKQAAYSFWLENKIRPTLFDEFKFRYDHELKSSHLLIAVDQAASPQDTLEAYNRLMEAREKILAGATIAELDGEYSSKRNGRSMGGDLPWFSVGATVKEFEDVLYSLDVGEISTPFRTQFGYHIVQLEEKRERQPARLVSHIFLRGNQAPSRLDSAYKELAEGSDWSETVKKYTQDTPSAGNGGRIGWIEYGSRYDASFIDQVMTSDPSLPFTETISTTYGYHLLKIDSVRTYSSEQERDDFLMGLLESSRTIRKSNGFIVDWLEEYYGGEVNDSALMLFSEFAKGQDSTEFKDINLDQSLGNESLFSFSETNATVSDFLSYLINNERGPFSSNYGDSWFDDFKEEIIDSKITDLALGEFPEFSDQTDNYKSGLVVYQINEDSVWSAATVDTTKLFSLYENDSDSYSYPTRYSYHLITSSRDTTLQKAIDFIKAGNSPDSVRANNIPVGVVSDSTGTFQGEPFDMLNSMEKETFSEIFEYNNRKAVFYLNDILPARRMTFKEAFNKLLSDYQPIREENWLNRLRNEYNVSVYPSKLEELYNNGTNE